MVPAKSAGLLPLSRLRTVRDSFPSYRSSISSCFRAALQENTLAIFVDIGHVWHIVLASHGFRDFIENLPFITDFHGLATVIAASILIPPNLFEASRQSLHSILKFALDKIFVVQIGICVHSYFCVADDRHFTQPNQFCILELKHPVAEPLAVPIIGCYPFAVLFWVTAFCPVPQHFIKNVVDTRESVLCADGLVIVRPATQLTV